MSVGSVPAPSRSCFARHWFVCLCFFKLATVCKKLWTNLREIFWQGFTWAHEENDYIWVPICITVWIQEFLNTLFTIGRYGYYVAVAVDCAPVGCLDCVARHTRLGAVMQFPSAFLVVYVNTHYSITILVIFSRRCPITVIVKLLLTVLSCH